MTRNMALRQLMIDLTEGMRRMATALQRVGIEARSFQIQSDKDNNVMLRDPQNWLRQQIAGGHAFLIWVALPRATWSRARRNTSGKSGSPASLRGATNASPSPTTS